MSRVLKSDEFSKNLNVKVGDRIRIIQMEGEPRYNGKEGVVDHIDSLGQLHGTWGGCAVIPNVDDFELKEAVVSYSIDTTKVGISKGMPKPVKRNGGENVGFRFNIVFNIDINGKTTNVETVWDFDMEFLYDVDYDRATNTAYKNFGQQVQVNHVNWDDLNEDEIEAMRLAFGNENEKNIIKSFEKGFKLQKEFNELFDFWFGNTYGNPGMQATKEVVDDCARLVSQNIVFLNEHYYEK